MDWSWVFLLVDFDNDGFKDIFVLNGVKNNNCFSDLQVKYDLLLDSLNYEVQKQGIDFKQLIDVMDFVKLVLMDKFSNYVYKNNGDFIFKKMVEEWGLELLILLNGVVYVDFDLDGDFDLVINNIDDKVLFYKNNVRECEEGNYLRFKFIVVKDQIIYGVKVFLYKGDEFWQLI